MELVVDKHGVISEDDCIPNEFYEQEMDNAVTLISLSVIRELYENGLLNKNEYEYICEKYKGCLISTNMIECSYQPQ